MRLFIALEIPPQIRDFVDGELRARKGRLPAARWVKAQNLHVTLSFLGEVDEEAVDGLRPAAEGACGEVEAFDLAVSGAGGFPPERPARVLWLGLEARPATGLARLRRRVDKAARAYLGLEAESRSFKPHLTLGRCCSPWPRSAVEGFRKGFGLRWGDAFPVDEAVLVRSHLGAGGPRYEVLDRFPLGRFPQAASPLAAEERPGVQVRNLGCEE